MTSKRVMRALDVLGRRWSLRVLWELREGPKNFRSLREACEDLSPSSLSQRLVDLKELGVVEAGEAGYMLTDSGKQLGNILGSLERWAEGPRRKRH
jgi:DNA-binding HxlR family transcriptional regulator